MTMQFEPVSIAAIAAALFLGGIIKGATGAGTPVIAVPVIAAFLDVRVAVVIMVIPNLMTNVLQQWQYRDHHLPDRFALKFAVAGGFGALVGTTMLASLPTEILTIALAAAIFGYIGLRLARPSFKLEFQSAARLVAPMGIGGGILQGMAGISAPVAVSFLNAMRLERPVFIATISTFFISMSLVQIVSQSVFGLTSLPLFGVSVAAMLPLVFSMPLGSWIARHLSAQAFDRVLLLLLAVLGLRLLYGGLAEFLS